MLKKRGSDLNTSGDVRKQIISLVRDFVKNEVNPIASKLDNDDEYPHELVDMMKGCSHRKNHSVR